MTQEQKELVEGMDSEQWRAIEALLQLVSSRFAEQILRTSIKASTRELLIAKAKYEGAQELIDGIGRARAQLKRREK